MASRPPPLVDHLGRPLMREVLTEEIAAPTMTGVRSIISGHPAQGLTPAKLGRILRDAEQGDATAYLELAEEMEEKDLHYLSVLGTRKRQVAQLPIEVDAAGDSAEEKDDAQLVRDWLDRDMLEAELFDILDAIGKGFSATELVWKFTATSWLPEAMKWRDPRFFEFDTVTGEQLLLREMGPSIELPPAKFIVHTHQAKSGLPIRGGLARIAAWGYMFKNFAVKDWVTFLETYGMPFRLGKYPAGTTEGDIRKLMQAVADLGSDAAAVIMEGMTVEFVDTKRGTAPNDLWRSQAEYIDAQISKAVLGQTGTTDMKAGGLGDGGNKVHDEVRGDIERADAKVLAATLNRDLVPFLVMLNRGPRERYPRIRIGRPDPVDVDAILKSVQTLVPMGVEVGIEDVRNAVGLPAPEAGAELLRAPATTPAAQPGEDRPQEGREGETGPVGAETAATAFLALLKSPTGANRRRGASPGSAVAKTEPAAPDAIDDAADEALSDWRELIGPVTDPIERLVRDAESYDQILDGLAAALKDMEVEQLREVLARAMFGARLAGDVDARPTGDGA